MRKILAGLAVLLVIVGGVLLWPRGQTGLTLYTGLDYGPAIAAAFTKETGIPVQVVRLSTGALLARISAQGAHPDWSIGWFDGATAAVALDQAGLLAHGLAAPADLTPLGSTMTSKNGAYVPTGFTMAGVFITASDPDFTPPTTWAQLTAPAYHGVVGMNDPSISGPTYPALAGMLQSNGGWPQGQAFIQALKQDGLHIYAKNDATLAALQSGAISLAIVQSSAALYFADTTDHNLHVVFPNPSYELPNVIVMAHGLHGKLRSEATQFIAFVNRPDIQALRMKQGGADGYYWPVTDNIAPLPALPALTSIQVAPLDADQWGALQNSITSWFASRIVGG